MEYNHKDRVSPISVRKLIAFSFILSIVLIFRTTLGQKSEIETENLDKEDGIDEDYDEDLMKDSLNEALKLVPVEYLGHFGYLSRNETVTEESFDKAVRLFQRFVGLPETGDIDEPTVESMKMVRCGNEDIVKRDALVEGSKLRYLVQGDRWNSTIIKYKISNYPKKFLRRRREINEVFAEAFEIWSKVIPVQFVRVKSNYTADIEIDFVQALPNTTCDKCQLFLKSSSIVAHAFYPGSKSDSLGGDIHFNGLIDWSIEESTEGEALLAVALHEIGHALGLAHAQASVTKMYPLINRSKQNLHAFDVTGVQKIYFKRATSTSSPETETENPSVVAESTEDYPDETCFEEVCKLSKNGFHPGPNCRQFYDCREEIAKLMTCPGNMVWNKDKNWCDFTMNVPACFYEQN